MIGPGICPVHVGRRKLHMTVGLVDCSKMPGYSIRKRKEKIKITAATKDTETI